ncbi:MAG: AbrB/MazE/SpoVT family DNA-binding domain-containing protein [Chloroflexota bacterium]
MRATIDGAGRLVIPRAIREAAGLRPGMALDVRVNDGRVELEPEPLPVELVRRGRLLVAVPAGDLAPLAADVVEETREKLRRERVSAE